jgi:hypothetical protein
MGTVKEVTAFVTTRGEYFESKLVATEQEAIDKLMSQLNTSLYVDHIAPILQAVRSYPQLFHDLANAHLAIDLDNAIKIK